MRGHRTDWHHRAREARRHRANIATTDERDIGIRRGVERVLGLDGPEFSLGGMVLHPTRVLRELSSHWFSRPID